MELRDLVRAEGGFQKCQKKQRWSRTSAVDHHAAKVAQSFKSEISNSGRFTGRRLSAHDFETEFSARLLQFGCNYSVAVVLVVVREVMEREWRIKWKERSWKEVAALTLCDMGEGGLEHDF